VAADLTDGLDDVLADLLREPRELVLAELVEILRALDPIEQPCRWLARRHEVLV
jgi:hypothetical protein